MGSPGFQLMIVFQQPDRHQFGAFSVDDAIIGTQTVFLVTFMGLGNFSQPPPLAVELLVF